MGANNSRDASASAATKSPERLASHLVKESRRHDRPCVFLSRRMSSDYDISVDPPARRDPRKSKCADAEATMLRSYLEERGIEVLPMGGSPG